MIVMKFGGSSLATADKIKNAVTIVKMWLDKSPVVVLSALGDTTDTLLETANQAVGGMVDMTAIREFHQTVAHELGVSVSEINTLCDELNTVLADIRLAKALTVKNQDYVVSFGERLSVRIFSAFANTVELKTKFYDAWDLGIVTTGKHGDAEVQTDCYPDIKEAIDKSDSVPIITGYLGKDESGAITTLGRGGSDLSASIIAVAIDAKEIQLWKDVDGIMTTDPKIVSEAQLIRSMTFQEAAELAYFGAKILHPRAVVPAAKADIPVVIKNSKRPSHPGTRLQTNHQKPGLRAITYKRDITLIDVVSSRMLEQSGFLAQLFDVFSRHKVSVDYVVTSEVSVTISLDITKDLTEIEMELKEYADITILKNRSIISLVGNVSESSEILKRVFDTLTKNNINVQMLNQGAGKANIGLVVNDEETETCLRELHRVFFIT